MKLLFPALVASLAACAVAGQDGEITSNAETPKPLTLQPSGRTPPVLWAGFGPQAFDLAGSLTVASSDACSPLIVGVANRVVLVDRGVCSFETKVLNLQSAGAIGVIVANNVSNPDVQSLNDDPAITPVITIPSLAISLAEGQQLKAELTTTEITAVVHRGKAYDNPVSTCMGSNEEDFTAWWCGQHTSADGACTTVNGHPYGERFYAEGDRIGVAVSLWRSLGYNQTQERNFVVFGERNAHGNWQTVKEIPAKYYMSLADGSFLVSLTMASVIREPGHYARYWNALDSISSNGRDALTRVTNDGWVASWRATCGYVPAKDFQVVGRTTSVLLHRGTLVCIDSASGTQAAGAGAIDRFDPITGQQLSFERGLSDVCNGG